MNLAFVIMQIGDGVLDQVYTQAIAPAINACGLEPRRIDKHNRGGLLKSEIDDPIKSAAIIVADLTNERPNCYLEVGYAMGLAKFGNVILAARDDHNSSSPKYRPGGPKVHFDLAGYDILFWDPLKLDEMRADLERGIKRRLALVASVPSVPNAVTNWLTRHQAHARAALKERGIRGGLEVYFRLGGPSRRFSQSELHGAASQAMFERPGYWPLAPIMPSVCTLQAKAAEVVAEINEAVTVRLGVTAPYWYWASSDTGEFYAADSYLEDLTPIPDQPYLFADRRILRVTEALLYAFRRYNALGVPGGVPVRFHVTRTGLAGRLLGNASRRLFIPPHAPTAESEVTAETEAPMREINSKLPDLVRALTANLFGLFNFFEPTFNEYRDETGWALRVLGVAAAQADRQRT